MLETFERDTIAPPYDVISETDREAAWPGYSYVIQSVRDGRAAEIHSWVLQADREGYDEEEITVGSTNDEVRSTN